MATTRGVNFEAWARNAVAFIREKGLEPEFRDWCGGFPCPVEGTSSMIAAAPDMYEALRHILEAIDTCGDDAVHYALANHQTLGDVVSEARAARAKARAAKAEG